MVQVDADQHGMVLAGEHALQGVLDAFAPALDVGCGHSGQGPGVALAVGEGFQDVAGGPDPGQPRTTEDSLIRAPSRSFSSRCHSRVRSRTSCSRVRVRSRSARISGGGTKLGRSSPISASRAIHWASSRSVLGRPPAAGHGRG